MKKWTNQYSLVFYEKGSVDPIETLYFDSRAEAIDHAARFTPNEGVRVNLQLIRTWRLEQEDFYQG